MSTQTLFEQVLACCAQDTQTQHTYLIIDQSAYSTLGEKRAILPLGLLSLLREDAADAIDGVSPVLADISTIGTDRFVHAWVQGLCTRGQWNNALTLLTSPLGAKVLQAQLAARTSATLPDNFNVVLRYFDTRILPVLLDVLKPEQRAAFLSCASAWNFVDREGVLQPLAGVRFSPDALFETPLQLDAAQEKAMLVAAEADAVNSLLDTIPIDPTTTLAQRYRRIASCVDTARTFDIDEIADMATFATFSLRLGNDFYLEGAWPSLLAKVKSREIPFQQAMNLATE